jgi:aspartate kinase
MGRKGNPYATDSLLELINNKAIQPRELDLLLSCGEIISAVILSGHLNEKGLKTKVFTGYQAGIKTNDYYGEAHIIDVNPKNILNSLKENYIAIVAGFQGATSSGEITTLGRGGSDISAVALGKSLKCQLVEIYTDVDGIMTADPNIVPNAKVLETMCYSEVHQLAEDGAKVIHPKAVEIAQQANMPLKIKNTFTDNKGTTIEGADVQFLDKRKNLQEEKIITAITYKKNRVQVIIDMQKGNDDIENFMDEITKSRISIDLINFFVDKKAFTIDKEDLPNLEKILKKGAYSYNIVKDCCKLSVIGYKMRGVPGVMARIVRALSTEGIKILQSSDSHNTIWCLVNDKNTNKALNALHKEFKLYE